MNTQRHDDFAKEYAAIIKNLLKHNSARKTTIRQTTPGHEQRPLSAELGKCERKSRNRIMG